MRRTTSVVVALACVTPLFVATEANASGRRSLGSRTLKQGMHGTDVRVLQDFLTKAGHKTSVDGQFGAGTKKTVRAWEKADQLKVDGKVTQSDARRLRQDVGDAGTGATTQTTDPSATTPNVTPKSSTTTSTVETGGAAPITPLAANQKATLNADGTATAAPGSPPEVVAFIAAANKIAKLPYHYGGGHGKWEDSGYDCSGSMSYALHGAGLLDKPYDSTDFESYGDAGPGTWMTIYANSGHSFMYVAGLRFDTSGRSSDGSRWHDSTRTTDGYTVRHPTGF